MKQVLNTILYIVGNSYYKTHFTLPIPKTEMGIRSHEPGSEKRSILHIHIHFSDLPYGNAYDEESKLCAGGKLGEGTCYVSESLIKNATCL